MCPRDLHSEVKALKNHAQGAAVVYASGKVMGITALPKRQASAPRRVATVRDGGDFDILWIFFYDIQGLMALKKSNIFVVLHSSGFATPPDLKGA